MEEGRQVSSDEARRDFRALLNSVEHEHEHVTISRYNIPAAVLVPVDWHSLAAIALEFVMLRTEVDSETQARWELFLHSRSASRNETKEVSDG